MPYLSLSSVMAEMNAAEADAKRFIDLAVNDNIRMVQPTPEEEAELKEKPQKALPANLLGGNKTGG